ncbi:ImmA/IrrE family metallo-endopeptidase [Paenibacillus sp. CAU 1782]
MEELDMRLYKPTELERWICGIYQTNGINRYGDMEDLDHIASLFNAFIAYTEGGTKVLYDEDGDCMIFLNIYLEKKQKRLAFFHELGHPAMHTGNQRSLPPSFVALQENQAGLFQQYAAMPFYILTEFQQQRCEAGQIAEALALPTPFVRQRLERIGRRIRQQREDLFLHTRLTAAFPPVPQEPSHAAMELLTKLNRQIRDRKELRL